MTTVIVIDDDNLTLDWVVASLQMNDYDAVGAREGADGITLIHQRMPDLVLCDVTMPVMDGHEVLAAIREDQRTAQIPFIFMTALSERDDMRYGMELGADDYLTKPFTPEEMLSAVRVQLKKRRELVDGYETTMKLLRDNIVYALPHELRTPLTGSMGYADLLRMDADKFTSDEVRDIASQIVKHNDRLYHVLENFLAYAQIEVMAANPEQLERLRMHNTGHVGEVVSAQAQSAAKRHRRDADLYLDVCDFGARISSRDLSKIVDELVDNAFKFSAPGSPVEVRVFRDDGHFGFSVRDQGRGMSDEQIASIGAYMQFNRALYEQQGLGFGLIIARRLAELHRGYVEIDSVLNQGTEVTVRCAWQA